MIAAASFNREAIMRPGLWRDRPVTWCSRCIMNDSAPRFRLAADGTCSFCQEFDRRWPRYRFTPEQENANLDAIRTTVRAHRRGPYDAILGVSGGVDSSYTALLAHGLGLNVLAVHFDNGWNSRASVANIRRIIDKTGFDLDTYVMNWPEFRDIQRAYFLADVIDIEAATDHAIFAAMFKLQRRHRIRTVLSGWNYATEHGIPPEWAWAKHDWWNIRAIHRKYGVVRLRTFPHMGSFRFNLVRQFGMGATMVDPLNRTNFRKGPAMEALAAEFGWEYYGGKHYESVFTKFYQAYVLPVKFGVDKRIAHLSSLVRIGEMTRVDALQKLDEPLYLPEELASDKRFVCKKLGFGEAEFDALMARPARPHAAYATDQIWIRPMLGLGEWLRNRVTAA